MTRTESFLEYKSLLFSVAYNMLGLVADAEDMVQDAYEKWLKTDPANVQNAKAYLVKIVTNTCINHLNKLKRKRKDYIGPWLPEPLVFTEENTGSHAVEMFHPLSIGIMVMLEKLTPQERAVFLLKEIFSYDYDEIADIINKNNDNCRQIFKRAQQHLQDDRKRFEIDMHMHARIFNQFLHACYEGDIQGLINLLQEDIVMVTDGGGTSLNINGRTIQALRKPLHGKETVAKFVITIIQTVQQYVPGFNTKIILVNNMPSLACFMHDKPLSLITLEIRNNIITNIFVHSSKEKLRLLM
ncbi:MAG: sigma-70 family RNA polymerase sigma factor [Parafilimonas sp.]